MRLFVQWILRNISKTFLGSTLPPITDWFLGNTFLNTSNWIQGPDYNLKWTLMNTELSKYMFLLTAWSEDARRLRGICVFNDCHGVQFINYCCDFSKQVWIFKLKQRLLKLLVICHVLLFWCCSLLKIQIR